MSTPDWFPDELAHAGEEHLDPEYVSGYDQKAGTDPTEDLDDLERLGLDATRTLIDLGAGTGTFTTAAAPRCRQVIAVDVSRPMLAVLEQQRADAGLTNIEIAHGGFLSYEHRGPAVDFVYTRHALHHLPDFWKAVALTRIAAMLKPGGVLFLRDLVYSCSPQAVEPLMEGWLANAAPSPDRGWTRAELATHLREEYSTFNWLLEPIIERSGFTIREARDQARLYATYICIRNG